MDAFNELDQESIYTRFFQNKKSLTDTELKRVTEPGKGYTAALSAPFNVNDRRERV